MGAVVKVTIFVGFLLYGLLDLHGMRKRGTLQCWSPGESSSWEGGRETCLLIALVLF